MISVLIMISMPAISRHSYTECEGNHENSSEKQQAGVTYSSDVAAKPLLFLQITSRCVFNLKKVKQFLVSVRHKYIYLFYFNYDDTVRSTDHNQAISTELKARCNTVLVFGPNKFHCFTVHFNSLNFTHQLMHFYIYCKTCLKRTPYIPETWTNGK